MNTSRYFGDEIKPVFIAFRTIFRVFHIQKVTQLLISQIHIRVKQVYGRNIKETKSGVFLYLTISEPHSALENA